MTMNYSGNSYDATRTLRTWLGEDPSYPSVVLVWIDAFAEAVHQLLSEILLLVSLVVSITTEIINSSNKEVVLHRI
jgi:hypothetical protein